MRSLLVFTTTRLKRFQPPPQVPERPDNSSHTSNQQTKKHVESSSLRKTDETKPPCTVIGWIEEQQQITRTRTLLLHPESRRHLPFGTNNVIISLNVINNIRRNHVPFPMLDSTTVVRLPSFPPLDKVNWRRNLNAFVTHAMIFLALPNNS